MGVNKLLKQLQCYSVFLSYYLFHYEDDWIPKVEVKYGFKNKKQNVVKK